MTTYYIYIYNKFKEKIKYFRVRSRKALIYIQDETSTNKNFYKPTPEFKPNTFSINWIMAFFNRTQ